VHSDRQWVSLTSCLAKLRASLSQSPTGWPSTSSSLWLLHPALLHSSSCLSSLQQLCLISSTTARHISQLLLRYANEDFRRTAGSPSWSTWRSSHSLHLSGSDWRSLVPPKSRCFFPLSSRVRRHRRTELLVFHLVLEPPTPATIAGVSRSDKQRTNDTNEANPPPGHATDDLPAVVAFEQLRRDKCTLDAGHEAFSVDRT